MKRLINKNLFYTRLFKMCIKDTATDATRAQPLSRGHKCYEGLELGLVSVVSTTTESTRGANHTKARRSYTTAAAKNKNF